MTGIASVAKVAQTLAEKAREAKSSDNKVTETYIKEVILVREHVLSNKKACAIVQEMDEIRQCQCFQFHLQARRFEATG